MTTRQAMAELERLGYQFEITVEGKIKGTIQGTNPPEATYLLEFVRRDRDSATAYVKERRSGSTVADDGLICTVFDAVAISEAVKTGEAQLLDKVNYHWQPNNVTLRWKPCNGQTSSVLLAVYRESLYKRLQNQMRVMEQLPDRDLTCEEIERLNREYTRCINLLNDYRNSLPVKEPCYEQ